MKRLVTALLCLTFASFILVGCGSDDPTNYTITATAGENGTITPAGDVTVEEHGTQQFIFTANSGYVIDNILIDGVSNISAVNSGNYTFANVTANHTIAASFKEVETLTTPNFWRIGDTEYALTAGEILYWGNAYNDNSSDMYLLLETGTLRFDEDEFWFTGKGNYLHLEIISSPAGLSSGTYNYVDNSAFTADDYTNGMLIEPEYVLNVDEANEEFYLITGGGQVTITVTDDIYKITFTLIDENGVSHTGHYEGPLTFHDFS